MTPLPERRKTPEELAALRESLGIPADAPPPPTQKRESPIPEDQVESVREELKSAVFEEPAIIEDPPVQEEPHFEVSQAVEEAPRLEPEISTSSSEDEEVVRLEGVIDAPKQVLNDQRAVITGQLPPKDGVARIPVRKHTKEELAELRRVQPPPADSTIDVLLKRQCPTYLAVIFYCIPGLAIAALLLDSLWFRRVALYDLPFEWLMNLVQKPWYEGALAGVVGGCCLVAILCAGWIMWRCKLSRHHAAFLTIIAVLVAAFGTLYFLPELHGA